MTALKLHLLDLDINVCLSTSFFGYVTDIPIAGFDILSETCTDSFEELVGNSTFEAFLLTGQY